MKSQTPSNKNRNVLTKSLVFTANYNSFKKKGDFDFFAEVQAGRITKIHEYFQSHKDEIPLLVNSQDNSLKTALFYAIYYNYKSLFLYLLTHSANPYVIDSDKQTIFHLACFFGRYECIGLFLNFKKHMMRTRLTQFLREKLIEYKIKKSALMQSQIGKGEEARKREAIRNELKNELEGEIYREREDWMEMMKTDGQERCPVHYSAFSKYTKCFATVKLLLEPHRDQDNWNDFLSIFEEIQLLESTKEKRIDPRQYVNIFQTLSSIFPLSPPLPLPLPSLLNSLDIHGYTPLHIASFHGDYLLLKYMIMLGGDPNLKDGKSKKEVLYFAMNDEVRNSVGGLVEAARKGDIGRVKELVNCGKEINEKKSVFGVAPIHNAIEFCHRSQDLSCLKTILTCEADINAFDSNGWTALHRACELGDPFLVSYLLSKSADQLKFSNKGLYPIHIAASNDKYKIIQILVEHEISEGNLKIEKSFKNLRSSSSILEVKNDKGETPLIMAAKKGNVASMRIILDHGGDCYAKDKLGWSSLHHASFNHHKEAVNLLCKMDADNDELRGIRNCQGKTPFELANKDEVKLAFQTLWRAATESDLDTVRRLIILEENINDQTFLKRYTPLMLAAKYNNYLIVHFLLEKGAREDLTDGSGLTAKDHARDLKIRNLVSLKMKKNKEIKDKNSIESKEMKERRLAMERKEAEVNRKIRRLFAHEEEL